MLQLYIITFFHMPCKDDEIIISLMVYKLIHYRDQVHKKRKIRKQIQSSELDKV